MVRVGTVAARTRMATVAALVRFGGNGRILVHRDAPKCHNGMLWYTRKLFLVHCTQDANPLRNRQHAAHTIDRFAELAVLKNIYSISSDYALNLHHH